MSVPVPVPSLAQITSAAITKLLSLAAQSPIQWGVIESGAGANPTPVLSPDGGGVLEFHYSRRYEVSKYPVQKGSFADYNKVISPFEIELRFAIGGTLAERTAFLGRLEQICGSIDLYDVITPEIAYRSCNPTRFEVHRRGGQGAYFLADVSLYFEEILQSTPQYSNNTITPFYPGISKYALDNAQNGASLPTSNVGTAYPLPATGVLANMGQSAIDSITPGTL